MPKVVTDYAPVLAVDTEVAGLDIKHGCLPYFVTTCDEEDNQKFWQFDVDPLTRKPIYNREELAQIRVMIKRQARVGRLVAHNLKFDVAALSVLPEWDIDPWPWEVSEDTTISSHLVCSNKPHNLTDQALIHLGINIEPYEIAIKNATQEARRIARSKYPEWRIAREGLPEMPSAKSSSNKKDSKIWKADMWLPRAIAQERNYPNDHPWWRVLEEYANPDSFACLHVHEAHMEIIRERGLEEIYRERMKVVPVAFGMEDRGVTLSGERLTKLVGDLKKESEKLNKICTQIALRKGHILTLPKSGNNKSLMSFAYGKLNLPRIKVSKKTGEPSLDKDVMAHYLANLPDGKQRDFVVNLNYKRQTDTDLNYLTSYKRFWIETKRKEWFSLFSSINPVGTHTLRWSSERPNSQNIGKQSEEEDEGKNRRGRISVRSCFGPAPGREWWSLDYNNLELRIPAYDCGEQELIDLFERSNEPPYYGSEHLLNFHTVYPDIWDDAVSKAGWEGAAEFIKTEYKSTWYRKCKAGDFAVGYGAVDREDGEGTADKAFGRVGSHARLKARFSKKEQLNQRCIEQANKFGYVETLPDVEVCPHRGYPIYCDRNSWGKVRPTVPLNYRVQSTACWVIMKAMIRVQEYLDTLRDGFLIMQIHDELVLDFPFRENQGNKGKVLRIKSIMESIGDCINVPLTCGVDYHQHNWAEGVSVSA